MGRKEDEEEPVASPIREDGPADEAQTETPPTAPADEAFAVEEASALSVTERDSSRSGVAPADASVHTEDGEPSSLGPVSLSGRRSPVSGAVLPHLREVIQIPVEPPPEPAWKKWTSGPPLVGILVFFAVLIGLPTLACCCGAGEEEAVRPPSEVDGVEVRPNLR